MSERNHPHLTYLTIMALVAAPAIAAAQDKYYADPYPGAVSVTTHGSPTAIVDVYRLSPTKGAVAYLTKDDAKTVLAWYRGRLTGAKTQTTSAMTMLVVSESKGEATQPYGITLISHTGPANDVPVFTALSQHVAPAGANLPGFHSQAEYDSLHARYKHLNTALYDISDERPNGQNYVSVGDALYERYQKQSEDAKVLSKAAQDSIAVRVQAAAMKGDMAEMQRLMKVVQSGGTGVDPWDRWVELLQKLDAASYQTLIVIDKVR